MTHYSTTTIEIKPLEDRWFELARPVKIIVERGDDALVYDIREGFLFDARSGGPLADFVVPNLGTQELVACWLVHDCNGYGGVVSFREANRTLRDMLRTAGIGWLRRWLVWCAVSISDSWFGFPMPGDREFRNVHPRPMFSVAQVGRSARI